MAHLTQMAGTSEPNSYSRKDSFNFNKLSQSLPASTNAPLTMNDRKLSAHGRSLLLGHLQAEAVSTNKSAITHNKSARPAGAGSDVLERKSSLKGFPSAVSMGGSFGSMSDLLRQNSLKNLSFFDQTNTGSFAKPNGNLGALAKNFLAPCFGSLASIEDHIMDNSRRVELRKTAIESDSDDDDNEVSAWDGTIAPGERPVRKLSSLGLNKSLSDLFGEMPRHSEGPKDGDSDGSAVTTKAHLEHLNNFSGPASTMTTTTSAAFTDRGMGKKKLSLRGQQMFSEAHAHIACKPPIPSPANTVTHRRPQPVPLRPQHSAQLEQHHFQRQHQQRLREHQHISNRPQYSHFGQQHYHPYQTGIPSPVPQQQYANYSNPNTLWAQSGLPVGYPGPGGVPMVNNMAMYNAAAAGANIFNPDAYFVGGMGEKKLSFSSMPPAHKKTKKKTSLGSRSKGSWTKAEDQLLKTAIEKHGMGSWQTISKLVHTRTAEQCRVRCRSISALNPDKKKGAFNETEDNLLKKISMILIRADAPGSPQKHHFMAVSAGFSNSPPAGAGRKRKNAGGKCEPGNDEFWFRVANEFNMEMQKLNLQKPYERTRKQLKERWQYNLDPSLNRGKWTEKENDIILSEKRKYRRGGWSAIAKLLPGRTPDMVKQRFNELLQEKMERDIM